MLQKFKNLPKGKKIIVGIIALMLLPITLLVLSLNLAYTGAKNKKIIKLALGSIASAFLIFSFIIYEDLEEDTTPNNNNTAVETSNEENDKENNTEVKEENKLSNEELIKKLETYENIYTVIPSAIEEASQNNDTLEMQKTFATGRDVLEKGWQELGDLRNGYDEESNEYKAIENLHLAFFTLRDACKSGIKYLDKNEYKYYEKYEKNCASAGAWINDYLIYKEKIQ